MLSTDPLANKYAYLSSYVFVANMVTNAIDPDGRDIWVVFKDDKSKRMAIKMFKNDYGIKVKYDKKNQMLTYNGRTNSKSLPNDDATNSLITMLSDTEMKTDGEYNKAKYGKIVFAKNPTSNYHVGPSLGPYPGFATRERDLELDKKINVAYINTTCFLEENLAYKGAEYINIPIEADNMARAFEHEYFGHEVYDINGRPKASQDGSVRSAGKAEEVVNTFRTQRGLPMKYNYLPILFTDYSQYYVFGQNSDKRQRRKELRNFDASSKQQYRREK